MAGTSLAVFAAVGSVLGCASAGAVPAEAEPVDGASAEVPEEASGAAGESSSTAVALAMGLANAAALPRRSKTGKRDSAKGHRRARKNTLMGVGKLRGESIVAAVATTARFRLLKGAILESGFCVRRVAAAGRPGPSRASSGGQSLRVLG